MDSKKLIKRIVDVSYKSKEGHIGSSLSVLNILYVLYSKILNGTDHFILSKGHSALGLYTILEHFDLLDGDLNTFCEFNSNLGGHPSDKVKHVEASTGSLGHGLPMGIGMALGEKIKNTNNKVFVVIGDGESNEGTIWESALLAPHHKLNNLYCVMDYNHSNDRALKIDNVVDKFKAFGWHTIEIDGHNNSAIENALNIISDKPVFILANTIKGNGIPMMENNPEWHHKFPTDDNYFKIINSIMFTDFDKFYPKLDIGQTYDEAYNLASNTYLTYDVDGDIAEVGVYSGGSAKVINEYKNKKKTLFLFDTFEGLKDCCEKDGEYLQNGFFTHDYEHVKKMFEGDDSVVLVKGYFPESTNTLIDNTKFSFIHLDVDTYQSTLNCLNYFYDKINKGGIIVVHDYTNNNQTEGVPLAVNEFLSDKAETVMTLGTSQGIIHKL